MLGRVHEIRRHAYCGINEINPALDGLVRNPKRQTVERSGF